MDAEYLLARFSETDTKSKKALAKFRHKEDVTGFDRKPKKRAGKERRGRNSFKMYLDNDTEQL